MKTWMHVLLAPVVAIATALPAYAAGRDSAYDRLDRQQARIDRGVDSGELTKREAGILRQEQQDIRDLARSLRRDGHSPREVSRTLNRRLDQSDRHIRRLTSNDEVRPVRHRQQQSKGRGY